MQKITIFVIFAIDFFASAFLASANDDKEMIGAKILKGVKQRDWSTFGTGEPTNPAARIVAHQTQAKPSKVTHFKRDGGSTSGTKPQAPVPKTKVLVLKSQDQTNAQLISEWKRGEKLNWSFICEYDCKRIPVKARASLVFRHSPFLSKYKAFEHSAVLSYPPNIVESIVTLMYEHKVTINKADYTKIIELAELLEMNTIVENAQTKQSIDKTQASSSGSKPQPSVQKQVLVLITQEKTDAHLILEWRRGEKLNWSFICEYDCKRIAVKARASLVFRHSPFLSKYKVFEQSVVLSYLPNIVESIVTLMYEHKVTVNDAEYAKIMELAKFLEMDTMISVLHDDVVRLSYPG